MSKKFAAAVLVGSCSVVMLSSMTSAATFTSGDLAVLDVSSGSVAPGNTGNLIQILEIAPVASATPVQTILDSTLYQSGTATSSALLN